jgi:hypothetical protein
LVIVPSFYLIMDDLSRLLAKLFGRLVGKADVEVEPPSPEILAERIALLDAEQRALRDRLEAISGPRPLKALDAAE